MEPLLMYLLKMLICSGILFGYYRLALYNESFHRWNRFYLLAALLISVVIPFISIPIFTADEPANIVVILSSMPWNTTVISHQPQPGFLSEDILSIALALISIVLFIRIIINIIKLVITYKTNPVSSLNNRVELVLTDIKHAPFSFFNWLFWRQDIDPASDNGQRMLTHELTHISEHHSADKIFIESLLCIFWMNPFFWLIRRELGTIHEFLADRKAVEQQDGAAFAAMILQVLHVQPTATSGLVNPFFSSQIKRRLLMITTSKEPNFSYARRLSGLLVMLCSAIMLTLSIQEVQAQQKEKAGQKTNPGQLKESVIVTPKLIGKTGEVVTIEADTIVWNENKSEVTATTSAGEKVKIELKQGNKGSLTIINPQSGTSNSLTVKDKEKLVLNGKNQPLFVWDGKEISQQEMEARDPNTINRMDVLKGEHATSAYGEKGKNGVVLITSKNSVIEVPKGGVLDVKTIGPPPTTLIIADGVEISAEEMKKINPDNIESVNVIKGVQGIEKYGNKAKEGVIEITTKQVQEKVFTRAEQPAQFPGGDQAWKRYLDKNFRYPDAALKAGTEGTARLQFIVDETGWISNVKIVSDPGNGIGDEAMRLIKKGPKWQPALQNGRAVVYQVELLIPFKTPAY